MKHILYRCICCVCYPSQISSRLFYRRIYSYFHS